MKKNNKGFTLVELIVVLVILAILAAILVPALLGYIDKAREGQYAEEAHAIFTAVQAYETEQYAKGEEPDKGFTTDMQKYVNPIVTPTKFNGVSSITYRTKTTSNATNEGSHNKYTVEGMSGLQFQSSDGKFITATLKNGSWDISNISDTAPSSGGTTPEG